MNHAKWIAYFKRNKQSRPEPDWGSPLNVPPRILVPVLRSVEQFRLGDGGGPASLIAFDRENFRSSSEEMRQIVDLWFAEEAEHADDEIPSRRRPRRGHVRRRPECGGNLGRGDPVPSRHVCDRRQRRRAIVAAAVHLGAIQPRALTL